MHSLLFTTTFAGDATSYICSASSRELTKTITLRQAGQTQQMAQPTNDNPCHLLKLPAELRNRIYRLALISDEPVHIYVKLRCETVGSSEYSTTAYTSEPAFLATCKDIRKEALAVFYGGNIFRTPFPSTDIWQPWLLNIAPEKRRLLNNVRVHDRLLWSPREVNHALRDARRWVEAHQLEIKESALHVPTCEVDGKKLILSWRNSGYELGRVGPEDESSEDKSQGSDEESGDDGD